MGSDRALLDQFLREDATDGVRAMLIARIQALPSEPLRQFLDFTFNRFNLHIDCKGRRVVLDDDLDTSPEGKLELDLDDFANSLKWP